MMSARTVSSLAESDVEDGHHHDLEFHVHDRCSSSVDVRARAHATGAGPGLYRRASERPVAPVSALAGTRVPPGLLQHQRLVRGVAWPLGPLIWALASRRLNP